VAIHVSSEALYELSNREAMLQDLLYLLPIVLLLCNGIICYSFRSALLGGSILVVSLLTIATTVGTLGWLGVSLNSISVMGGNGYMHDYPLERLLRAEGGGQLVAVEPWHLDVEQQDVGRLGHAPALLRNYWRSWARALRRPAACQN
jgi:hypothetical protein